MENKSDYIIYFIGYLAIIWFFVDIGGDLIDMIFKSISGEPPKKDD